MLKLISLNIESHKHLELVIPFLQREQPDVVSLQEVFEVDMPELEKALGMQGFYSPMANVTEVSKHQAHALGVWGLAQFTRLPVKQEREQYYRGDRNIPVFMFDEDPNAMSRVLRWLTVEHEGKEYTLATTHFTWSVEGKTTDEQERDYSNLQKVLDTIPEFVLSGDFNSPRGISRIFDHLAERYTDNIPPEVETSIDGQFHKAGQLQLMVDGLFSTPEYSLSEVRVEGGVSDHKALVAQIQKA